MSWVDPSIQLVHFEMHSQYHQRVLLVEKDDDDGGSGKGNPGGESIVFHALGEINVIIQLPSLRSSFMPLSNSLRSLWLRLCPSTLFPRKPTGKFYTATIWPRGKRRNERVSFSFFGRRFLCHKLVACPSGHFAQVDKEKGVLSNVFLCPERTFFIRNECGIWLA